MTDLSTIIKIHSEYIADKIHALYEDNNMPRTRLGLSEIGHECNRYLWYKHHGYIGKQPDGQKLDLFKFGNILEKHMINLLRKAGFQVYSEQKQVEFYKDDIHLTGSIDGIIEGLQESKKPHLLEAKSCNKIYFNRLVKLESYEEWNPKYKAQVHAYMLGLGLDRCLVAVYCKDTSRKYFERIRLDKPYIKDVLKNAFRAISNKNKPLRSCGKPDFYKAKFCSYQKMCFELKGEQL